MTMFICASPMSLAAQGDTTFVYLTDGNIHAFPAALLKQRQQTASQVIFTDIDDGQHAYRRSDIASESATGPGGNPWLTVFKFNNKYNDNVFVDVLLDPSAGTNLTATVPCIGKWLTPSFQCNDDNAAVYVGAQEQHSKETRRSFASDVTYTCALPGRYVLRRTQEESVAPTPQPAETYEDVTLSVGDLSTNAPSNNPDQEGLQCLIDGDPNTFFHSTWGDDGPYAKLPLDSCPWVEVKLPTAMRHMRFTYATRFDNGQRSPLSWEVQASTSGTTWKKVAVFTQADGIPEGAGQQWTSPTIDMERNMKHVRLIMTSANYKNYLCLSELAIIKVTPSQAPEPTPTASGRCDLVPMGTNYNVHIDFPTDRATNVPRIDLNLDGYDMITSKTTFIDATISIDGAGVFPDMMPTPVQVKGRGNSSWDGNFYGGWYSPKNPYRLRFADKEKPFGLTKGRNWVLLANKISGSMTTNAIGMKVACLMGTDGCNHIIPVELYINGEYRGSYNFTEKVGLSNNSIDVENESVATLLELDTYSADPDESPFTSRRYSLPVRIKKPNFTEDVTELTKDIIIESFNELLNRIATHSDISDIADVESLARFYAVNEFILNLEIMHPKSTFIYRADLFDSGSLWKFGPVWDLDWAFGHELNQSAPYFTTGAKSGFLTVKAMEKNALWSAMRRCGEPLDRAIYSVWHHFMEDGGIDELEDFCDEYYAYAQPSFTHNYNYWGDGANYGPVTDNAKTWLRQRAEYIYSRLTPYDLTNDIEGITEEQIIASPNNISQPQGIDVYDLRGVRLRHNASTANWREGLPRGLYIVNGRKVLVD
jgi:hypothetical protein